MANKRSRFAWALGFLVVFVPVATASPDILAGPDVSPDGGGNCNADLIQQLYCRFARVVCDYYEVLVGTCPPIIDPDN